jgi:hypothetical protein
VRLVSPSSIGEPGNESPRGATRCPPVSPEVIEIIAARALLIWFNAHDVRSVSVWEEGKAEANVSSFRLPSCRRHARRHQKSKVDLRHG